MANDPVRTPPGMAGIMGFQDSTGSKIALDPRAIYVFAILFIVVVEIGSLLLK